MCRTLTAQSEREEMGKRGPKPGTKYGPRKEDTELRRYWRELRRRQRAKKRREAAEKRKGEDTG